MSTVCAMTQASTTTELPGRQPGRAARIAALFMLAQWFVEHPEIPMPTSIIATWVTDAQDEPDQATRYAAVHAIADQLDAREYGSNYGDQSPQFDYEVASKATHGVEINYRGTTFSDAYYRREL